MNECEVRFRGRRCSACRKPRDQGERCSVHFHIDGSGLNLEGIKRLAYNTRVYEPWIYQIARGGVADHWGRNGNHYRYYKPIEEVHRSRETDYDGLMKSRTFKRFWSPRVLTIIRRYQYADSRLLYSSSIPVQRASVTQQMSGMCSVIQRITQTVKK